MEKTPRDVEVRKQHTKRDGLSHKRRIIARSTSGARAPLGPSRGTTTAVAEPPAAGENFALSRALIILVWVFVCADGFWGCLSNQSTLHSIRHPHNGKPPNSLTRASGEGRPARKSRRRPPLGPPPTRPPPPSPAPSAPQPPSARPPRTRRARRWGRLRTGCGATGRGSRPSGGGRRRRLRGAGRGASRGGGGGGRRRRGGSGGGTRGPLRLRPRWHWMRRMLQGWQWRRW